MFKNKTQRGPCVEVFSAQDKEALDCWKLKGISIKNKQLNQDIKSFVYSLSGTTSTTEMELPKDSKQTLGLIQGFLVVQVFVPSGVDFAINLCVCDTENQRRTLRMSTTWRDLVVDPLSSKIPLGIVRRATWLNLCINLSSLIRDIWAGSKFMSLERIGIAGNCHLRRVFTMRSQAPDTTDDHELYAGLEIHEPLSSIEPVPKECRLSPNVSHLTQVINYTKIRCYEARSKGIDVESFFKAANADNKAAIGPSASQNKFHIAFGSRAPGATRDSTSGSGSLHPKLTLSSRHSHSRSASDISPAVTNNSQRSPSESVVAIAPVAADRQNSDPGSVSGNGRRDVTQHRNGSSSAALLAGSAPLYEFSGNDMWENLALVPRPPPKRSADSDTAHRRRHRVKSSGSNQSVSTHKVVEVVATEAEVENILREMQAKAQQRIQGPSTIRLLSGPGTSESESGMSDSMCTSEGVDDSDSSLTSAIRMLKENILQDTSVDSEESVYQFTSGPTVPSQRGGGSNAKRKPRRQAASKQALYPIELESINKLRKSSSNDNCKRNGRRSSEDSNNDDDNGDFSTISETSHIDDSGLPWRRFAGIIEKIPPPNLLPPELRVGDGGASPRRSTNMFSVRRSALVPLPQNVGGSKVYCSSKYSDELTDSQREQMVLRSLQKESVEATWHMKHDGDENVDPYSLSRTQLPIESYSSDDDDNTSTLRSPNSARNRSHDYHNEIGICERDWGGSTNASGTSTLRSSTDITLPFDPPASANNRAVRSNSFAGGSSTQPTRHCRDDFDDDKLDLCYDEGLKLFFDPKTEIYYELITGV